MSGKTPVYCLSAALARGWEGKWLGVQKMLSLADSELKDEISLSRFFNTSWTVVLRLLEGGEAKGSCAKWSYGTKSQVIGVYLRNGMSTVLAREWEGNQ